MGNSKKIEKANKMAQAVNTSLPPVLLAVEGVKYDTIGGKIINGKINLSDEFLIRLYTLNASGVPVKDISEILKVQKVHLQEILKSQDYIAVAQVISKDIVDYARLNLASATTLAVNKMVSLIESEDEKIALRASIEVLNRVGIDTPKEIHVKAEKKIVHEMSNDQLLSIIDASNRVIAFNTQDVKDTSFEEVDDERTSDERTDDDG